MIYTGYFAQVTKYKGKLISIAGRTPDWFNGDKLICFMPKYWFFNQWKKGIIDNDVYTSLFKSEVLDKIQDKDQILQFLSQYKYKDKDVFLLCYEKPVKFCHRHIVGKWISEQLNTLVQEWGYDEYKKL